jgi:hypothetical protein
MVSESSAIARATRAVADIPWFSEHGADEGG